MDTSKGYIEMCEKATEIQNSHEWEYGDWLIAEHGCFQVGTASFHYDVTNKNRPPIRSRLPIANIQQECKVEDAVFLGGIIWLPRQDQLQEMLVFKVGKFKDNFWSALNDLHRYAFTKEHITWIPLSMEQLWLDFVMKEKYNKIWDGKKWISKKP